MFHEVFSFSMEAQEDFYGVYIYTSHEGCQGKLMVIHNKNTVKLKVLKETKTCLFCIILHV